jgi:hypothetical protein
MKSLINWNSFYEKKFIPITLPFLVRFRLNLGLNNLKFVHKSISAVKSNRFDSIRLIRFDRVNSMESIRLVYSYNFAIFGPI